MQACKHTNKINEHTIFRELSLQDPLRSLRVVLKKKTRLASLNHLKRYPFPGKSVTLRPLTRIRVDPAKHAALSILRVHDMKDKGPYLL